MGVGLEVSRGGSPGCPFLNVTCRGGYVDIGFARRRLPSPVGGSDVAEQGQAPVRARQDAGRVADLDELEALQLAPDAERHGAAGRLDKVLGGLPAEAVDRPLTTKVSAF